LQHRNQQQAALTMSLVEWSKIYNVYSRYAPFIWGL
jgi:hypothetical protein